MQKFQKTPVKVNDVKHPKRHGWVWGCSCGKKANIGGIRNGAEYYKALKSLERLKEKHKEHDLEIEHSYHAAELTHALVTNTTLQTHGTATYTTKESIEDGTDFDFIINRKYLLMVHAELGQDNGATRAQMRIQHGSTTFLGSTVENDAGSSGEYVNYTVFFIWAPTTAGEALEDINLQIATANPSWNTRVDNIQMMAVEISEDLTENTDWFNNEDTSDDALTSTPLTKATVTFTPATNGEKWLCLCYAQMNVASTTVQYKSRIDASGTETTTIPEMFQEGEDTAEITVQFLAKTFTLNNESNTIKNEVWAGSTSGNCVNSNIFLLNLDVFDVVTILYTAGIINLGTSSYADSLNSGTITPTVTGDVFALVFNVFDCQFASAYERHRLQIDSVDEPTGQSQAIGGTQDNLDQVGNSIFTVKNLSNASHDLDHDANTNTGTNTPHAQERTLVAFTFELAGGATEQFARPSLDQAIGSWEDEVGGTTNIYTSIDEVVASDADFIRSELNPASNSIYEAKLSSVIDPQISTGHIVRYRYDKVGTQVINLIVRLKQGGSTIASNTHNGITSSWVAGTFTLSAGEADSITDYTDLRIEFEADVP